MRLYSLKFYQKDWRINSRAYDINLNEEQAQKIFKVLTRHYKLHYWKLVISPRKQGGTCHKFGKWIMVGKKTSMGILAHEVAHAIQFNKEGRSKHNKKLMKLIKQVHNFIRKSRMIKRIALNDTQKPINQPTILTNQEQISQEQATPDNPETSNSETLNPLTTG